MDIGVQIQIVKWDPHSRHETKRALAVQFDHRWSYGPRVIQEAARYLL
jgi:hypothetical protein